MTYAHQLPPDMQPSPGPWHVHNHAHVHDARGQRIASVRGAFGHPANTANAYLMAAAPELREAIPLLIKLVHRLLPKHAQSDSTLDNLPEVIQARAALAKSTPVNPSINERNIL